MTTMNKPPSHDVNWYQAVTDNWMSIETNLVDQSILTTKGDLIVANGASSTSRLGPGADGQSLMADGTQPGGVKWVDFSTQKSIEMLWGKKFFRDEGFLPSTKIFEYLGTPPPFLGTGGTGSWTREPGEARPGTDAIAWYDLGAQKSKILIVVGNMAKVNSAQFMAVHLTPDVPSALNPSGYCMRADPGIFKCLGGTYTSLGTGPGFLSIEYVMGYALYYDDASGALKLFGRAGGQWFQIRQATDSTFTTLRYFALQSGGTANQRFVTPFVCYAQ